MKKLLTLTMVLGCAACGGGGSEETADNPSLHYHVLEGVTWRLLGLEETPVPAKVEITATFADGKVSGRSACNRYFAETALDGERLTVGMIGGTKMLCPDDVMDWENSYRDLLADAATWKIADERLQVRAADGRTLTFARETAPER